MSALELPAELTRVLSATFGSASAQDIRMLHGGRSGARLFALRVCGQAYVVRIPALDREQHQARCEREISCMELAAQRGIGPAVHYAERATGITISSLIESLPPGPARAALPGRVSRLAATLRTLHGAPRLPGGHAVTEVLQHFDAALRAAGTGGIPRSLAHALEQSTPAAGRFSQLVLCHNDLNPGNVLETAEAAFLIDWETAGDGDPFVDLAQLGVFALPTPEARAELLAAYLGRAPTPRERAHATLARVTALGFYAVSFTTLAVLSGEGAPAEGMPGRPMREIFAGLATGTASARDVAACLQHATLQEAASEAFVAAKAVGEAIARRSVPT